MMKFDREILEPKGGWQTTFTKKEKKKLRPIAETLAMIEGNAFFSIGIAGKKWYEQYLPEAKALYDANGGDKAFKGITSFI